MVNVPVPELGLVPLLGREVWCKEADWRFHRVDLRVGKKVLKQSMLSEADNPSQLACVTRGKMRLMEVVAGGMVLNVALEGSLKWS